MAFSAAEEPILMRERRMVMTRETKRALSGSWCGRMAGASMDENGRPLLRANAQSWRDAVASTAIELAVRLMMMIAAIMFVPVRLFVVL